MSRILPFALVILILIVPTAVACDLAATVTADPMNAVCHGLLPTLNAAVSGGDGNYDYQWFRNASPIDGATASSFTVPSDGYYWVDVTDGNGCYVRSNTLILHAEDPSAEITVWAPACIGMNSTAQVPDGGASAIYEWSVTNGTITAGGTGNWIYFSPTASPVTVNATVTMPSGCSASGSKTVEAGESPDVTISASGPLTFCAGGSVTLTAHPTNAQSIVWNTGSTEDSITVTTPGTYWVTATNASGCTKSAYESVDVIETRAIVSGGSSICPGSTGYIDTYLTGVGPWVVTWSDGLQATVGAEGARSMNYTRAVQPAATTTYSITALDDASSCSGSVQGNATITVREIGAVVSGGGTMCPSSSVTLRADLTGTPPFTLLWSDGNVQSVNGWVATRNVSPSSTTTYTITTMSDRFCGGSATGSATATIAAPPTATVSGGTINFCPGGSATLSVAFTGTAPWTIRWNDNVTQSNITTPAVTRVVAPATATSYYVTVVSDASCTGNASGIVTAAPRPTPTAVVSGSATICAGGSATVTAALTGTAPFSVTWSDGVVTSTGTRAVSPATTTTYTVTSVSDAYCSGSGSGSAVITVDPLPVITAQPQSQSIKRNTTATLSVTASSPRPMTYQWYRGASGDPSNPVGTNSATFTTPRLSATTQYWVRVSSSCGATNSATATITVN